jgi:transcriptional regulator with GAF, ATPase, and Fis domain
MDHRTQPAGNVEALVRALEAAARGLSAHAVFARLHAALASVVGFKVLTVLKLDPATLRSARLYSSEPSYPVGGTKQHMRGAWSEAVLDRKAVFVAPDLAALRAAFPDSAPIEATGCESIVATPIIHDGAVVGTMNLWHRDGYFDEAKALLTMPFADVIARVVRDADPTMLDKMTTPR